MKIFLFLKVEHSLRNLGFQMYMEGEKEGFLLFQARFFFFFSFSFYFSLEEYIMDRSIKKDYDWLISRKQTAYEILDVDANASFDVIRKAYRRKALIFHPDKNKESNAADKFREINISYLILSDLSLKNQYNDYLSESKEKVYNSGNNHHSKDEKVSKFKSDLLQREQEYKLKKELELMEKRKNKSDQKNSSYDEYKNISSNSEIQSKDMPIVNKRSLTVFPKGVIVTWKNKEHFPFDRQIIERLMSVFGVIVSVEMNGNKLEDNYHFAKVIFSSTVSAALASTHDYSRTADLWDKINLRKISSLLRSVKLVDESKLKTSDPLLLSKLDYISYCILET